MPRSPVTSRFGASVRSLRFRLGITQEELAERADMHRTYITGVELGARNLTLKSIDRLAKALEVPTAALLSSTGKTAPQPKALRSEQSDGNLVDILMVEDNPKDLELALTALEDSRLANEVAVARDGVEALDYLQRQGAFADRPDTLPVVVLLDLKLPRLNGLEVLARIRADPALKQLPVVVLSSSREEPDLERCYALGVNAYIVKPVDLEQVMGVIKQIGILWGILNVPPPSIRRSKG